MSLRLATLLVLAIALRSANCHGRNCQDVSDCKDPFNSFCLENKCHCKRDYPIIERSGVCLDYVLELDLPCWLTEQCRCSTVFCPLAFNNVLGQMIDAAACLRPSGRQLDSILDPLWEAYVQSNGSARYIPGTCRCARGFRNVTDTSGRMVSSVSVELNEFDLSNQICKPRAIGASCKTSYECSSRARYSRCEQKQCVCFNGFSYVPETDHCERDTNLETVKTCPNGETNCDLNELNLNENSTLHSIFKANYANLIGFSASMGFILVAWFVCWKCNSDTEEDTTLYR